jgi:hypothetical protein
VWFVYIRHWSRDCDVIKGAGPVQAVASIPLPNQINHLRRNCLQLELGLIIAFIIVLQRVEKIMSSKQPHVRHICGRGTKLFKANLTFYYLFHFHVVADH